MVQLLKSGKEKAVAKARKNYDVGYKKPPKDKQWPQGVSGNPHGRPPKPRIRFLKDITELIMDEGREEVTVNNNGEKFRMSSIQALVKSLKMRALNGDYKAIKLFLDLAQKAAVHEEAEFEKVMELLCEMEKNIIKLSEAEIIKQTGMSREETIAWLKYIRDANNKRFPT